MPRTHYYYDWVNKLTDDPKGLPKEGGMARLTLGGFILSNQLVRKAQTGPEGWISLFLKDRQGILLQAENGKPMTAIIYGDVDVIEDALLSDY